MATADDDASPRAPPIPARPSFRVPPSVAAAAALNSDEEDDLEEETPPLSDGEVVSNVFPSCLPAGAWRGLRRRRLALLLLSLASSGLKVLVVGATGRTGRLVVSRLVPRACPAAASCGDVARARAVLPESSRLRPRDAGPGGPRRSRRASLHAGARGLNAVVWAAGVPSLVAMFKDPLAPLRVEAEGVANLVAAFERSTAERKAPSSSSETSPPPRFVLISSIGADNVVAQLAFPGGVLFW